MLIFSLGMEQKYKTARAELMIFGGSGLVGSEFLTQTKNAEISAPSKKGIDVRDFEELKKFLSNKKASTVINFVGYTNLVEAEKERGNKEGGAWELNVNAARNIAEACRKENKFLIYISTDAVFPGTLDFPGPYSEDTEPTDDQSILSWYGYTKLMGEKSIQGIAKKSAIVRISHPFGSVSSQKDFARKVISYIQAGYVLFDDQYFTPTYLKDLGEVLLEIATTQRTGVFHVVCTDLTTPFKFAQHIARNKKLKEGVKMGKIDEWAEENPNHYPRVKYGGLEAIPTQAKLGVTFHTWQEALDEFLQEIT